MKLLPSQTATLLLTLICSSCSSTRIEKNHTGVREALLQYNEDQVIDNIIRAYNRRPIIHFDIGAATATVKTSGSGGFGGGQALERTGVEAISGGVSTVTNTLKSVRPGTFTIGGGTEDTLDVDVKPVLNSNEVYTAYEAFSKEPGRVRQGKPTSIDSVHVGKTWSEDGQYYWIPSEYAEEYFQLSLRASVKRGEVAGKPSSSVINSGSSSLRRALESPNAALPKPDQSALEAIEDQTRLLRKISVE